MKISVPVEKIFLYKRFVSKNILSNITLQVWVEFDDKYDGSFFLGTGFKLPLKLGFNGTGV